MVIPPRDTTVPSARFEADPSVRDTHLLMIASLGRMGWQEVTGYGRRALVETAMGRYKGIIGARLRARGEAAQRTEAIVGVAVLNRMLDAGRPNSVRRQGLGSVDPSTPAQASISAARCNNAEQSRTTQANALCLFPTIMAIMFATSTSPAALIQQRWRKLAA